MPRDKDLKRIIRTRMQKTGEAYTTARANITKKPLTKKSTTPQPDYAVLAGKSDAVIEEKTGRTWQQWVQLLDKHGAAELPHGEIARLVQQYDVGAWWTQTVTVGYERIKGLRALGQRRDGSYEANKSKTFSVPVETLFDACADARTRRKWLRDATIKVRSASAQKAMRIEWSDGSVVILGFTPKGAAKSVLSVQHTKLPSEAARERLKAYWAERLGVLAEVLSG